MPKTYRNRRALRVALTVALTLVLSCVILAVALFFGLKKRVVYTEDGLRLELPPWLEENVIDG